MPLSPEEAHYKGVLDLLLNNNLSSVKIYHQKTCTTWDISAKHQDIDKAKEAAIRIDYELREEYL